MVNKIIRETIKLTDSREIILETGKLAKQANGSVVIKLEGTMLLAAVVKSENIDPDVDFLPLSVDYRENFFSAGKIRGGFIKREGRPSDDEILTMRLVDRLLRPMFPSNFRQQVQVMISVISYDGKIMPDSLAALAASSALMISNIPFNGPVSAVRLIRKNGIFFINPEWKDLENVEINLIVGANEKSIIMLEGDMQEISEEEMLNAIFFAHEAIKNQIIGQKKLVNKISKFYIKEDNHNDVKTEIDDNNLKSNIYKFAYAKYAKIAKNISERIKRNKEFELVLNDFIQIYSEKNKSILENNELKEKNILIKKYFYFLKKEIIKKLILIDKIRLDKRTEEMVRPIWCEVNYLPGTHGSAIFTRGETQSLASVTLGSSLDTNKVDNIISSYEEKFYLHYNFPPFSTGEVRPIRGISRREIGHGNLAQRSLKRMIPNDCPYTIRVVSDILESNGSSSMATVCSATLALMDAGIQIKEPISGIAMGLIIDEQTGSYSILSDLSGEEDHFGDMDLKIVGSKNGITGCQMDIKIKGLSFDIIKDTLKQAKKGRLFILDKMLKILPLPRRETKNNAPKIATLFVEKQFIGLIIGPGGKNIQQLQKETQTIIFIEETENKGRVEISSRNLINLQNAINKIKEISFVPKIGEIYYTKIKSIKSFGVFVELSPGIEGLLHISEIDHNRIEKIDDILKIGDKIQVKFLGFDHNHKMKLSRRVLLPK